MRYLLLALALAVQIAQEAPEPPPGWFCSPRGQGDHRCACKRMADPGESCERVTEQASCKVYCHADHCKCPVTCEHKS